MRRIPAHILRRNRNNSYAEEQAQGYQHRAKTGGPCARCGKLEDDHIFGDCDDLKGHYTPKSEETAA